MDKNEIVLYQLADTITVETRLKFNALPSPEVSSADVRNIQRGQGYIKKIIHWLSEKNALGEYHNADKNWDIIFNSRSVRNVMGHKAGDGKVALLEYVPSLIENGIYLETIPKGDGLSSHIFAAKATFDGKPSTIGFVVREDANGKRYYDHAIRFEDKGRAESGIRASETTAEVLPDSLNSIF